MRSRVESHTWHLVPTLLLQLHFSPSTLMEGDSEISGRTCLVADD